LGGPPPPGGPPQGTPRKGAQISVSPPKNPPPFWGKIPPEGWPKWGRGLFNPLKTFLGEPPPLGENSHKISFWGIFPQNFWGFLFGFFSNRNRYNFGGMCPLDNLLGFYPSPFWPKDIQKIAQTPSISSHT